MVTAVMFLAAAGCGGGSSVVTAPNTPEQLAADKALAKQAVLRLGDLPAGYTASPHTDSGGDLPPAVEREFLACSHLPKRFIDDKAGDQPNADAPDFKQGNLAGGGATTEIQSSVEIDRSSKNISEPLAYLAGKKVAKCFEPFFRAAIAQAAKDAPGMSILALTVKGIPADSIGDQRAAFQGRVTIAVSGISVDVYFDLYFVRKGRAVLTLLGLGTRAPVSRSLEYSLLRTVVSRLKGAT
jgi:hypothetical protein